MPVEAKKTNGKPFNPSLGGAFANDAFTKNGEAGILLNVTAENFDTLMKNVQIGSSILFRFNKVTTKGNKHYFVEILPPMAPKTTGAAKGKVATAAEFKTKYQKGAGLSTLSEPTLQFILNSLKTDFPGLGL